MADPVSNRVVAVRAVFFDYDGVLAQDPTGTYTTTRYIAGRLGISQLEVEAAWREAAGEIADSFCEHKVVWPVFCAKLGQDVPLDFLPEAFASTLLDAGMLDLAVRLKRSCRVGIITDNRPDRFDFLCQTQNLEMVFDPVVVSSRVGYTKASEAIFEHALQYVGLQPAECVFIDNAPENLTVAGRVGLHCLYFDDRRRDLTGLVEQLKGTYGLACDN
jgi:putative hydrolase of the HAD superfamily